MFCCEFCEIFKNTFFTELLPATVSAGIGDFRRNVFQKQSPVVFCKKAAASEPLFIRLQARPATLSKKTPKKVFFYEYCKTFKNTYFVIEKKIFFEKIFVFLQNIYYLQKKSFYMEKQVL